MNERVEPPAPGRRAAPEAVAAVVDGLAARFGDRLTTSRGVREHHGHRTTWLANQPPDAVVFPLTTDEVSAVVRLCAAHRVPIIPFGTGTSLEGHVNAPHGGVCIDTSMMNAVVAVHAEDFDCVVQPGVTRKALNDQLRDTGLFFPVDPGADASLGGMASTRASGTAAVRYGTMRDNVLALTVVTADGAVVQTARRARKSSAGYDLTRLFVGAEGTLGVITELTLKLAGIPEAIAAATCRFPSVAGACEAAIEAIQSGIPVARVELADALTVRAVNTHSRLGLTEAPMLFLEFHGTPAGVREQAERFGAVAAAHGGGAFQWTDRTEERTRLWQARHDVYLAQPALRPGARPLATDVCVPISRLAECVVATQEDAAATGLVAPVVGHVGDGNFHVTPLVDMGNPDEVAAVQGFVERLIRRGLDMEGTCTGEHGVGQAKMKYMREEHPAATLDVMRAIKRSLDPHDIMNPGKVVAV